MCNEKIKELRLHYKYTQEQIGTILNTTKQYYQKYEKGLHPLPIDHLKKLCLLYKVSADYILDLPDNLTYPK